MRIRRPVVLALGGALLLGCSSSSSRSPAAATAADASTADAGGSGLGGYDPNPFGGSRPASLYVPMSYSPSTPTPLLFLLHGYSANGGEEDIYLDLHATAESLGLLYIHPDGTVDASGNRFWNATNACCDFYGSQVDDVAYLMSLISEIETRYNVDPKRIYFFGHSNGGFMSYRMACDHAETVAAIASLAGAMWFDTSMCKPSEPVAVLEVHGTADMTVDYDGGTIVPSAIVDGGPPPDGGGPYPSAPTSVSDWVAYDGCSATGTMQPTLDITAGMTTTVLQYQPGCKSGTQVDLWSMQGAGHIPGFTTSFCPDVVKFLLAHPKP